MVNEKKCAVPEKSIDMMSDTVNQKAFKGLIHVERMSDKRMVKRV